MITMNSLWIICFYFLKGSILLKEIINAHTFACEVKIGYFVSGMAHDIFSFPFISFRPPPASTPCLSEQTGSTVSSFHTALNWKRCWSKFMRQEGRSLRWVIWRFDLILRSIPVRTEIQTRKRVLYKVHFPWFREINWHYYIPGAFIELKVNLCGFLDCVMSAHA